MSPLPTTANFHSCSRNVWSLNNAHDISGTVPGTWQIHVGFSCITFSMPRYLKSCIQMVTMQLPFFFILSLKRSQVGKQLSSSFNWELTPLMNLHLYFLIKDVGVQTMVALPLPRMNNTLRLSSLGLLCLLEGQWDVASLRQIEVFSSVSSQTLPHVSFPVNTC